MSDKKTMGDEMLKSYEMPESPLQKIFEMQEAFGSKFCNFRMYAGGQVRIFGKETKEWRDNFLDCIFDEVSEVLNWLPWKHWKDYSDFEVNVAEIRFELIDILHFIVSEFLLQGISAEVAYDSIIDTKMAAFRNVTDLEELLSYAKGALLSEVRVDTTILKNKIDLTRGILRNIISYIGKGYTCNSDNPMNEIFLGIFFSLLQLMALWDMSAQDVFDHYMSKNKENFDRQNRGY